MRSTITYIIAYKHTPQRLFNLQRVLEWLAPFGGLEILIVEQDKYSKISDLNLRAKHMFIENKHMFFNKSWAFNVGAKYATTPVLMFGDCDLIMEPNALVQSMHMLDQYELVNPYSSVVDLTPEESHMQLGDIFNINRDGRGENGSIEKCPMTGGLYAIHRESYFRIGGQNESFLAWGGEDDHFTMKAKMFLNYIEMPNKSYHLYHDKVAIDQNLYHRNLNILDQFRNVTKEQMQQHINMSLPTIGHINKYQ